MARDKVAVVGSGNWGTAIAKMVAANVESQSSRFERNVYMWVFEEMIDVDGGGKKKKKKLTEVINETHVNAKYLPDIKLPDNVVATSDLLQAVKDAKWLIFVIPHQFITKICGDIKGKVHKDAHAISLIKGVDVNEKGIKIFANVIADSLDISCSALSGANIANEVALEKFCETTIGYRSLKEGEAFRDLFQTNYFRVRLVDDCVGVSLGGALKNVVAIAAGFIDGLGWGDNAKAAIMRAGLVEMKNFSQTFFENVQSSTFTEESAGIGDLITSCYGGRNRKCAEAFVKTKKPLEQLERELLKGQKLQGTLTALEVNRFLRARNMVDKFPLFTAVYEIAHEGRPVESITQAI